MIRRGNISDEITDKEYDSYLNSFLGLHPDMKNLNGEMCMSLDGEGGVNVYFKPDAVPFQRIRRITGYLVGTLDRFNNAKRAEVNDRVRHTRV